MPEGLEAMGAESLRDILTFIDGDAATFRVVDLRAGLHGRQPPRIPA